MKIMNQEKETRFLTNNPDNKDNKTVNISDLDLGINWKKQAVEI